MNFRKEFNNYLRSEFKGLKGLDIENQIEDSLTPYILEERKLNVTQMDVFSRLLRDRIIWLAGPVNDRMSTTVQAQLTFLENLDNESDIKLYCDTPGGSVKSGLSIIDAMDLSNCDIHTLNTGMCASMGSVLLSCGTPGKRASLRFSEVMTHQVSHGTGGNIQDTRITHREAEKHNYMLFGILGERTGLGREKIMEMSQRDRWYNAYESKEYGFIDEIIEPEGHTLCKYMDGFDEYYKNLD